MRNQILIVSLFVFFIGCDYHDGSSSEITSMDSKDMDEGGGRRCRERTGIR